MYHPIRYPNYNRKQISDAAYQILEQHYGCKLENIPLPIEVDTIAEKLGYRIEYGLEFQADFGDSVSGLIDFNNNAIWIRSDLDGYTDITKRGRGNFTLAHEIGHHALHRHVLQELPNIQSLFPIDNQRILCRASSTKEIQEKQADRFASRLLMPSVLVHRKLYELTAQTGVDPLDSAGRQTLYKAMKEVFDTSYEAMSYRLTELRLLGAYQSNRLF